MKYIILGSGCIGGFIGSCLIQNDGEVLFIGRDRFCSNIEKSSGILIKDVTGWEYKISKDKFDYCHTNNIDERLFEEGDIIIISVKSRHTDSVAERIKPFLEYKRNITIISMQNGADNANRLRLHFPDLEIITGIFGSNVVWSYEHIKENDLDDDEDNKMIFHRTSTSPLYVQESKKDSHSNFVKLMDKLNDVKVVKNIEGVIYGKLLLNLHNAINAITGLTLKEEFMNFHCRKVLSLCQLEAIKVLNTHNIKCAKVISPLISPEMFPHLFSLPNQIYSVIASKSLKIDPAGRSSMYDDIVNHYPTEIDELNGKISEMGKKKKIDTPVNDKIVDIIREFENSDGPLVFIAPNELYDRIKEVQKNKEGFNPILMVILIIFSFIILFLFFILYYLFF